MAHNAQSFLGQFLRRSATGKPGTVLCGPRHITNVPRLYSTETCISSASRPILGSHQFPSGGPLPAMSCFQVERRLARNRKEAIYEPLPKYPPRCVFGHRRDRHPNRADHADARDPQSNSLRERQCVSTCDPRAEIRRGLHGLPAEREVLRSHEATLLLWSYSQGWQDASQCPCGASNWWNRMVMGSVLVGEPPRTWERIPLERNL